ncbi:MAG: DUF6210 family protein, partial [Hyphomicrobiaceae bacterium]
ERDGITARPKPESLPCNTSQSTDCPVLHLRNECDDLIDYFWLVEGGYSWTGLSPADADEVDATLADYGFNSAIRVDRARLRDSYAAWVWVATTQIATRDAVLQKIHNGIGILTWDDGATAAERVRNARWKGYVGKGDDR